MKATGMFSALGFGLLLSSGVVAESPVNITPSVADVEVLHNGEAFTIEREQDPENMVNPVFARTSRPCPPFCIQPMRLAPGVETVGELEVLGYLQAIADGDDQTLVVDSRGANDYAVGTIPGAVNLPWKRLSRNHSDAGSIEQLLVERFGARRSDEGWDFSDAKTLVMFCNGMWCGQSPTNIKALLRMGYPAERIKWYRGGMQNWENLGLTTAWE